jgi:peptidoglycan/LPS O-acetylase OafA/YrhL
LEANQRPYFKNLDALRFLAASLVVFGHCTTNNLNYLQAPWPLNNFLKIITTGGHWVSLFFVLSGFLIGYLSIVDKLAGKFSIPKFLIRRVLRIWPLYFLMIFLGFYIVPLIIQHLFQHQYHYSSIWYFVSFLGNFAMIKMYQLNDFSFIPGSSSVLWSVSIEEQFYIVLAVIVAFLPLKSIKWSYLFVAAFGLGYVIYIPLQSVGHQYHSFYFLLDFFTGAVLGYSFAKNPNLQVWINKHRNTLKYSTLGLSLVLIFIANFVFIKIFLIVIFNLVILYFCAANDQLNRTVEKQNWLIWGGKISYGIYVIHPFFQYAFYKIMNTYLPDVALLYRDLMVFGLTMITTLITAYLSFIYFESPFLRLKAKFY